MRSTTEITREELEASRVKLLIALAPKLGVMWSPKDLHFEARSRCNWSISTGDIEMNLPPILKMVFKSFQLSSNCSFDVKRGEKEGCMEICLGIRYQLAFGVSNGNDLTEMKEGRFCSVAAYYDPDTREWSVS